MEGAAATHRRGVGFAREQMIVHRHEPALQSPLPYPAAHTSGVALSCAGYGVGTVGRVRFGPVSVFSSGFPAGQSLSFLLPSTRAGLFRVNGSQVRVLPRELPNPQRSNRFQTHSLRANALIAPSAAQ
jgi:hypothetical protein